MTIRWQMRLPFFGLMFPSSAQNDMSKINPSEKSDNRNREQTENPQQLLMLRIFIDVGRFYPITIFTNRKAEELALF